MESLRRQLEILTQGFPGKRESARAGATNANASGRRNNHRRIVAPPPDYLFCKFPVFYQSETYIPHNFQRPGAKEDKLAAGECKLPPATPVIRNQQRLIVRRHRSNWHLARHPDQRRQSRRRSSWGIPTTTSAPPSLVRSKTSISASRPTSTESKCRRCRSTLQKPQPTLSATSPPTKMA